MLMQNIVIIKNEEQKFTQILKTRKQEVLKCNKDFNYRQIKAFVKNHFKATLVGWECGKRLLVSEKPF